MAFLHGLLLLGLAPPSGVWRNYEEVFDLAASEKGVLAATNGGLIRFDGTRWAPVPSPASLRSIFSASPLVVELADGSQLQLDKKWNETPRARSLAQGKTLEPGAPWPADETGAPEPPAHPYSLIRLKESLLAGTNDGLYRFQKGVWRRETLPTALPLSRPNGIAKVGGTYVIGGLGGLYLGRPGAWKKIADDAIRQIATHGREVWVVHGNGAVDKIDPGTGLIYPDVLTGGAKRPWTACVGFDGDRVLLGGHGGWVERSRVPFERYPPELVGDVVTAIDARDNVLWIGTQKNGVLRFGQGEVQRWNPGNELPDTWVKALVRVPKGLMVVTNNNGLFRISGDDISQKSAPGNRLTAFGLWRSHHVVGGMDGAWIWEKDRWNALVGRREETTSINVWGNALAITTASGVYFY